MKDKEKNQDLPMPSDDKKAQKIRLKLQKDLEREEWEARHDVIFYDKLKEEPVDETAPLRKGSIDVWFFIWSVLIVCFGAIMSYSASAVYASQMYEGDSMYFFRNYIIYASIAAVITAIFVIFARPWFWRVVGVGAYALSILLLVLVVFIGDSGGGATRWIAIGPITIQPSEIAKMAVVMMLAIYMAKYEKQINSTHKFSGNFKHGFLIPMMIIGLICGLVIIQPHLSGTIIIGLIGVSIMFLAGTRIKWLAIFLGIIAVVGFVFIMLFGYTMDRVQIWLNIDNVDPLGDAWQTLQGLNAIGSGGFFGLGLGSSRQKYGYVSQPQNDFIFTIICEELGFIGAFLVIFLFVMLVWRGIKIGQNAPNKFCSLVVWGLTLKIALQVLMNIAVVTNSMPNTGISLPFFSSGGTALMLQIFEIGIILSISRFSSQKK